MSLPSLTDLQKDAICEFLNIGMGCAAASLSAIVRQEVHLNIPTLEILRTEEASQQMIQQISFCFAGIKQRFDGFFHGDALLFFPKEKCSKLANSFIQHSTELPLEDELVQDALLEMGNIILNACLSGFANLLNSEITYGVPKFIIGDPPELLQQVNHKAVEHILFMWVNFSASQQDTNGYVILVLEVDAIEQLKQKIDQYLMQF